MKIWFRTHSMKEGVLLASITERVCGKLFVKKNIPHQSCFPFRPDVPDRGIILYATNIGNVTLDLEVKFQKKIISCHSIPGETVQHRINAGSVSSYAVFTIQTKEGGRCSSVQSTSVGFKRSSMTFGMTNNTSTKKLYFFLSGCSGNLDSIVTTSGAGTNIGKYINMFSTIKADYHSKLVTPCQEGLMHFTFVTKEIPSNATASSVVKEYQPVSKGQPFTLFVQLPPKGKEELYTSVRNIGKARASLKFSEFSLNALVSNNDKASCTCKWLETPHSLKANSEDSVIRLSVNSSAVCQTGDIFTFTASMTSSNGYVTGLYVVVFINEETNTETTFPFFCKPENFINYDTPPALEHTLARDDYKGTFSTLNGLYGEQTGFLSSFEGNCRLLIAGRDQNALNSRLLAITGLPVQALFDDGEEINPSHIDFVKHVFKMIKAITKYPVLLEGLKEKHHALSDKVRLVNDLPAITSETLLNWGSNKEDLAAIIVLAAHCLAEVSEVIISMPAETATDCGLFKYSIFNIHDIEKVDIYTQPEKVIMEEFKLDHKTDHFRSMKDETSPSEIPSHDHDEAGGNHHTADGDEDEAFQDEMSKAMEAMEAIHVVKCLPNKDDSEAYTTFFSVIQEHVSVIRSSLSCLISLSAKLNVTQVQCFYQQILQKSTKMIDLVNLLEKFQPCHDPLIVSRLAYHQNLLDNCRLIQRQLAMIDGNLNIAPNKESYKNAPFAIRDENGEINTEYTDRNIAEQIIQDEEMVDTIASYTYEENAPEVHDTFNTTTMAAFMFDDKDIGGYLSGLTDATVEDIKETTSMVHHVHRVSHSTVISDFVPTKKAMDPIGDLSKITISLADFKADPKAPSRRHREEDDDEVEMVKTTITAEVLESLLASGTSFHGGILRSIAVDPRVGDTKPPDNIEPDRTTMPFSKLTKSLFAASLDLSNKVYNTFQSVQMKTKVDVAHEVVMAIDGSLSNQVNMPSVQRALCTLLQTFKMCEEVRFGIVKFAQKSTVLKGLNTGLYGQFVLESLSRPEVMSKPVTCLRDISIDNNLFGAPKTCPRIQLMITDGLLEERNKAEWNLYSNNSKALLAVICIVPPEGHPNYRDHVKEAQELLNDVAPEQYIIIPGNKISDLPILKLYPACLKHQLQLL